MRTARFLALSLVLLGSLPLLGGCDDDPKAAHLRAIHASIDAPAVDIYLAGDPAPIATGVSYGGASAYVGLVAGTYQIELRTAGDEASAAPLYTSPEFELGEDTRHSAVALGALNGTAGLASGFQIALYPERFGGSGSENARARVIHASPDAPSVAIDLDDDGVAEIAGLSFGEDSGPNGFNVPADLALQIGIRDAATGDRLTAFTTPELSSTRSYTILATGYATLLPREEGGFQLLAVDDQANSVVLLQNPTVFALHASPDAPAVDISAGETLLVENLAFGELSDEVQVPPGSYSLDFRATGETGDPAASVATPVLEAGERYLAIASGFLLTTSPDFTLVPVGDAFALGQTNPRLRVVHASSDAPAVDVGSVDDTGGFAPVPEFVDLAYGESSPEEGTALTAGLLTVGISETGLDTPVATFDVDLPPAGRLFAVAGGSLLGPGETFRLFLVDTTVFPWTVAEVAPNVAAE